MEPPSSLTDVAMRGLRRSALLMAQFTVRPRHGAPLRRALRVCSSTCTLVSVLRLSTVRVCVQPALLRGTEVPNLHYSGIALNSAGPALLRALSVSRDFACTIPGTCTIQPSRYRDLYCMYVCMRCLEWWGAVVVRLSRGSDTLLGDVMTQFMTRHDAS